MSVHVYVMVSYVVYHGSPYFFLLSIMFMLEERPGNMSIMQRMSLLPLRIWRVRYL